MNELHHDVNAVMTDDRVLKVGNVVSYRLPGEKPALEAFYADGGEVWLSTDRLRIQSAILGNIGQKPKLDICHRSGPGGFAVVPSAFLRIPTGFQSLTISIHNLETGLFTVCGTYPH